MSPESGGTVEVVNERRWSQVVPPERRNDMWPNVDSFDSVTPFGLLAQGDERTLYMTKLTGMHSRFSHSWAETVEFGNYTSAADDEQLLQDVERTYNDEKTGILDQSDSYQRLLDRIVNDYDQSGYHIGLNFDSPFPAILVQSVDGSELIREGYKLQNGEISTKRETYDRPHK